MRINKTEVLSYSFAIRLLGFGSALLTTLPLPVRGILSIK